MYFIFMLGAWFPKGPHRNGGRHKTSICQIPWYGERSTWIIVKWKMDPSSIEDCALSVSCKKILTYSVVMCKNRWMFCGRRAFKKCFPLEGFCRSMGKKARTLWWCLELLDGRRTWLLWVSSSTMNFLFVTRTHYFRASIRAQCWNTCK